MKTKYNYLNKLVLLLLLFVSQLAFSQTTLEQCREWARNNHPVLKQSQILEDIAALKVENHKTNYLPQLNLNGQATYQSDVTNVNISLPGVSLPSVSKDQYKMYIDFSQTIWDGGVTEILKQLAEKELDAELQKVEVEIYAIQENVNQFFFTQLKMQQNMLIMDKKEEILNERKKMMETAVENGVVLASELDYLKAELIRLEQQRYEIESVQEYCTNALSILTRRDAATFQKLQMPNIMLADNSTIQRPELDLFQKQQLQLDASSELLQKQRNPKLFGFGQAGYGRPALNMLNDSFDTYYLLGVGVKWNIHDWKKTQRNRQEIELKKQIIDVKENDFKRKISLAAEKYTSEISKLKKLMDQDEKLIQLQENITKTSAAKLDQGTITFSDYIEDLNAGVMAQINFEMHKIQLQENAEAQKIILGKL